MISGLISVTAFWAALRFGHPHSQIPSVLGIPFSYYCSVLGIPRYPPGMPKSLAFWSSPPKNAGFRGKIENVLDMASAKYRDHFQYLKKKAYREVLYKAKKKFAKKFEYDSKLESLFYVAKEKDGTALRRLVVTEEEKARVFEAGATLLLSLDTPAAIILLHPVKVVPKV